MKLKRFENSFDVPILTKSGTSVNDLQEEKQLLRNLPSVVG